MVAHIPTFRKPKEKDLPVLVKDHLRYVMSKTYRRVLFKKYKVTLQSELTAIKK